MLYRRAGSRRRQPHRRAAGGCMLVRRDALDRIGGDSTASGTKSLTIARWPGGSKPPAGYGSARQTDT